MASGCLRAGDRHIEPRRHCQLDAGGKVISSDKPLAERFRWDGKIMLMYEEHAVVEVSRLPVSERLLLMPQDACTMAYATSL